MTLKKHFVRVFWEVSMACGALLVQLTVFYQAVGNARHESRGNVADRPARIDDRAARHIAGELSRPGRSCHADQLPHQFGAGGRDVDRPAGVVYPRRRVFLPAGGGSCWRCTWCSRACFYSMNYVHAWISARDIKRPPARYEKTTPSADCTWLWARRIAFRFYVLPLGPRPAPIVARIRLHGRRH